jgi:hypothetical protein
VLRRHPAAQERQKNYRRPNGSRSSAPANLFHRKMRSGGSPSRIAAAINHRHLQVAAMAGGAERAQILFGVGRIVVPAGGEACGRFALIHPGPAVALVMNMKPVLSRGQPRELRRDHQAIGAVRKGHCPNGLPTPAALIELIVAVAVAARPIRVPTKRKLATSKLRIVIELTRNCMLVAPFARLLDGDCQTCSHRFPP